MDLTFGALDIVKNMTCMHACFKWASLDVVVARIVMFAYACTTGSIELNIVLIYQR
jgi:hypothetical protein